MKFEKITKDIIGAAIEVHKVLGPGLLESAYEKCLDIKRNKFVHFDLFFLVVIVPIGT